MAVRPVKFHEYLLRDISLSLKGEVRDLIDLDLEFLKRNRQSNPDPWGTSQPHNAYKETSIAQRLAVGHEDRLQARIISKESNFHESILSSPSRIQPDADYMITLDKCQRTFGSSWRPRVETLNDFEKECKANWPLLGGVRLSFRPTRYITLDNIKHSPITHLIHSKHLAISSVLSSLTLRYLFVLSIPYVGTYVLWMK